MLVWRAPVDTVSHGKWKLWWKKEWTLFSVWEPPMAYLAWKVFETLSRFCWWDGYTSQNVFISKFSLWALAPLQIPTSLNEGPFFYFMQFLFWIWVSTFSYKAPTKGHYDCIWALCVANIRVCFMNGSMIEHDGLGITCFSVDILKDMVACWYGWVLKSSCQY